MVLGKGVLEPMTFDLGILALAMMIHAALSVGYAVIFALIFARLSTGSAVLRRCCSRGSRWGATA